MSTEVPGNLFEVTDTVSEVSDRVIGVPVPGTPVVYSILLFDQPLLASSSN